jgi:transposase-like protein
MEKQCKYCGSKEVVKNDGGNQRYKCRDCRHNFTITDRKYSIEFKLKRTIQG